jgi:uncharacterized protein (TIGR02996 family)
MTLTEKGTGWDHVARSHNPEDHLIYADWLEESGLAERAAHERMVGKALTEPVPTVRDMILAARKDTNKIQRCLNCVESGWFCTPYVVSRAGPADRRVINRFRKLKGAAPMPFDRVVGDAWHPTSWDVLSFRQFLARLAPGDDPWDEPTVVAQLTGPGREREVHVRLDLFRFLDARHPGVLWLFNERRFNTNLRLHEQTLIGSGDAVYGPCVGAVQPLFETS